MDRRLFLNIQGGRQVSGVLRGFDMFLNLVVDNAFEELGAGQRKPCGMVVSYFPSLCWIIKELTLCFVLVGDKGQLGVLDGTGGFNAGLASVS